MSGSTYPHPTAGAANSSGSPFDVYTGGVTEDNTYAPGMHQVMAPPTYKTEGAGYNLKQALSNKSPQQIRDLQTQLSQAGYSVTPTGVVDSDTVSAYGKLLQDVHLSNQTGSRLSPEEYLAQKTQGGAGGTNGTRTDTSFTNPVDARAAALSAFENELGRKPTQKQMDAFYQALHAYEAANPSTTTTSGTNSNYQTTTSGGAGDLNSFAQQYVDQSFGGEAGVHSALHYFDLIANALGSPTAGANEVI